MPATLIHEICAGLPTVSLARRTEILGGPTNLDCHAWLHDEIAALAGAEIRQPPQAKAPQNPLRVLFWNAERGRFPDAQAGLLAGQGAAVNLICELDCGMARTHQRHTARDLADRLGQGYAFAAEFLELGLGDQREQACHAGEDNLHGLHGSAILSPHALSNPVLIRLERDGHWFSGDRGGRGERRIGGRIAQAATLIVSGVPVVFAVVHFESHSDPDHRAGQMADLLEALEDYAPGAPAIIGGDFNTSSAPREALKRPGGYDDLLAEDPHRLMNPIPHEPLFTVAADAGFNWTGCNDGKPTQRLRNGETARPLGRIDWFFARGLAVSEPVTIPAVDLRGRSISDHDALAVTVRLLE